MTSRRRLVAFLVVSGCVVRVDGTGSTDDTTSDATSPATTLATTNPDTTSMTTVAEVSSNVDTNDMTGADVTTSPTGDDTVGETTGVPTGECTENLIADGGFEGGTPSEAWTEMSLNFGTPICDTDCTQDPGADPYLGDWYVWFGGIDTDPEVAVVSQAVEIGPRTAFLSFRFQINAASGTGDDVFDVTIDDTSVFMVTDAEIADYDGYTPISIDISDFADGGVHTVAFTGDLLGVGLTNFFLDEVALVTCVVDGDTTGTSGTTAADSGAGSTTGATSGSGGSTSG